jgi:hypothetical protein
MEAALAQSIFNHQFIARVDFDLAAIFDGSSALGNISTLDSSILDASKPQWEQLVGHDLNVLRSILIVQK